LPISVTTTMMNILQVRPKDLRSGYLTYIHMCVCIYIYIYDNVNSSLSYQKVGLNDLLTMWGSA